MQGNANKWQGLIPWHRSRPIHTMTSAKMSLFDTLFVPRYARTWDDNEKVGIWKSSRTTTMVGYGPYIVQQMIWKENKHIIIIITITIIKQRWWSLALLMCKRVFLMTSKVKAIFVVIWDHFISSRKNCFVNQQLFIDLLSMNCVLTFKYPVLLLSVLVHVVDKGMT